MPGWSPATRAAAPSPAGCAPSRCTKPTNGSTATSDSGPNASINSPHSWRKTNGHRRHRQTEPHHQAPLQRAAGESLRRLDRPGKNKALDGPGRDQDRARGKRSARRRPLSHRRCRRRPARSTTSAASTAKWSPNEKLVFTWAWKIDAGARVAGHGDVQARRRRHAADLTHEQFFDEEARDRHQGGWNGAMEKLEKYLA